MQPFKSYETAKVIEETERLPVGGYILKILDAEETEFKNGGKALKVSFDIAEGEYKGFFANNYKSQTNEDKRWKGTLLMGIPVGDNSEQDNWKANAFKSNIAAIEESNKNYHWDWKEEDLKNKIVGAVFFNKEYDYNGRQGFFTACHSFRSVESIKNGKFKIPKDKLLNKQSNTFTANGVDFEDLGTDEDCPF